MPPRKRAAPKAKTSCRLICCTVPEETVQQIRESVEAGRHKSMFSEEDGRLFGPNCRCGVPRKPPGLAKHINDDGVCVVHPDCGPQPWTRGAERPSAIVTEGDR